MAMEPPDKLEIAFRRDASWLRAHVAGESTLENTVAYWRAIVAELQAAPAADLLLVDELLGEPLTEQQWFHLVRAMDGTGLERVRIAHVKPNGLQRIEYCEIYARDAGIDAHVFDDEQAAMRWLRYGERDAPAGPGS